MEMGLAFNKDNAYEFKFDSNSDKQIVAGPAMIPDLPLYRRDADGYEFYVVFTKEVIEKLAEKFNKENKGYQINLDHAEAVESAFIKSNWIIEDSEYDKSKMYGFDNLPVGTWFLEVKVDDADIWANEIKGNNKFGFSVEGMFDLELTDQRFNNNKTKNEDTMKIEDLMPEELAMIEKFRAESTETFEEEKEEEEIAAEDAEDSEEIEVEAEVEVEAESEEEEEEAPAEEEVAEEEEAPAEEAPEEVSDAVRELVNAKYDELLAMIAELNSKLEGSEAEEEEAVEFSKDDNRLNFIKNFRAKG